MAELPGLNVGPAGHRLTARLLELAERRIFPACATAPDHWFDGGRPRLEAAAAVCGRCPAIESCAAAAEEQQERHGVWGGLIFDRSA